jgi:membrane-associated phospholipid phosphatase
MKTQDLTWFVPFAGLTAGFIESDSWFSKQIPAGEISRSKTFSNYATYSLIGAGAGSFFLGHIKGDDQMSEAGLLSGEAAINATVVAYLLKDITRRQRPYQANGAGKFFESGSSFPSEHSAIAWSVASVMAHEYPGTLTKILAYGLATGVSATRVTGQQHFPSDVIVGSALGWYFGRQVYRAHHDSDLGGEAWGNPLASDKPKNDETRNPANMGSPDVPLDSWVYPSLERLIALGYIKSGYLGIRPWTRMECARMLDEAQERIQDEGDQSSEAARIYNDLADEFSFESGRLDGGPNTGATIDSIYTRFEGISGPPLRDGFHFASTIVNDYGRPYAGGFNNITGLSAHTSAGNFFASLQGEYQNAGPTASEPLTALEMIASGEDATPALPNAISAVNRLRLLDSSAGFTFGGFQISAGKESLWLGPGSAGPFLFSDNAEPITMVRVERVSPAEVPGLSRILGPLRTEFAIGRLAGTEWVFSENRFFGPAIGNQPFVHIEKISFKPTGNFEFGMGVSAVFGGPGSPVTFGNFLKTFSPHCSIAECSISLAAANYGDRRSTADFAYRLPHLRDWVTVYGDSLVEDEISPIGSSRPALQLGVYLPRIPKLNKLDLRAESLYTDAPNTVFIGNYYSNSHYRSGYTNYGQIMGSWIGRAGKGGQAWATYWLSPRSNLQLQYRREVVSREFLAGGGLNDFAVKAEFQASSHFALQSFLQYETWNFPALAPTAKSDVTASVQLTFYPHWHMAH